MSTITKQMQELLFDDDRPGAEIGRLFGLHRSTVCNIMNKHQTISLKFAIDYAAEKGWSWQLVDKAYLGDPWQQIRCAIAESGHRIEAICKLSGCDRRTIDNLFRGVRAPHVKTLDAVAVGLGLQWRLEEVSNG